MKHFIFLSAIIIAAFTGGFQTASAQVGTFCSAKTAEGVWAVKYGPESIAYNCAAVQRVLRANTATDITDSRVGYYNVFGVNRVFTRCGFYYRNILASTGSYALQNAINTAQLSGLTHCLFMVNDF